jgi:23S rRNA (pseudouridine1915-N3)-methyltransferase
VRLLVFAFGKLKTPGLRESADHYKKMIRPWAPLEEFELKPVPAPDKSAATRLKIQARETELLSDRLAGTLSPRGALFLLDERGKAMSTQEWARLAREWEESAVPEAAFCVASHLGFSDRLRARARGVFSLGPQTLSHELARVVLLEQLYRAWSVVRGHPYHNEG